MEYKPYFDRANGSERINRMIFDNFRSGMYLVCDGRKHDYTVEDVRKAVMLTSMLHMPTDDPQVHLVHIALYVIQEDWDGMLDYYTRFVAPLPGNNSEQRAKARKYFEDNAKRLKYEGSMAENAMNVIDNFK